MIKNKVLLVGMFFYFQLSSQTKAIKQYVVSGKVTHSSSYCGGLRPSEEQLAELTKPKPYVGKVFYVKKGKTNQAKQKVIQKIVIDSLGNFSIKLPAGTYCLIQAEQLKSFQYKTLSNNKDLKFDKACIEKWWQQAYYVLEIKEANIEGLSFHFNHPCFINSDVPCISYTGPMPP